ncbi:unnamed protein product [Amoebophrya sp. A25]|nr:unnamed protein product [Amoebophrya sp. A25]|eukprot:GSA25T00026269001.1
MLASFTTRNFIYNREEVAAPSPANLVLRVRSEEGKRKWTSCKMKNCARLPAISSACLVAFFCLLEQPVLAVASIHEIKQVKPSRTMEESGSGTESAVDEEHDKDEEASQSLDHQKMNAASPSSSFLAPVLPNVVAQDHPGKVTLVGYHGSPVAKKLAREKPKLRASRGLRARYGGGLYLTNSWTMANYFAEEEPKLLADLDDAVADVSEAGVLKVTFSVDPSKLACWPRKKLSDDKVAIIPYDEAQQYVIDVDTIDHYELLERGEDEESESLDQVEDTMNLTARNLQQLRGKIGQDGTTFAEEDGRIVCVKKTNKRKRGINASSSSRSLWQHFIDKRLVRTNNDDYDAE